MECLSFAESAPHSWKDHRAPVGRTLATKSFGRKGSRCHGRDPWKTINFIVAHQAYDVVLQKGQCTVPSLAEVY